MMSPPSNNAADILLHQCFSILQLEKLQRGRSYNQQRDKDIIASFNLIHNTVRSTSPLSAIGAFSPIVLAISKIIPRCISLTTFQLVGDELLLAIISCLHEMLHSNYSYSYPETSESRPVSNEDFIISVRSCEGGFSSISLHLIASLEPLKGRSGATRGAEGVARKLNADDESIIISCFKTLGLMMKYRQLLLISAPSLNTQQVPSVPTSGGITATKAGEMHTNNNGGQVVASARKATKLDPFSGPFLAQLVQSILFFSQHR
jgi:hypothetical protein